MRVFISCLLILTACHSDGPTVPSDGSASLTPPDGVLRATAVQAKPGDEAILVVTGAKLTALRAAWFKLPNQGDADSVAAHFTIGGTGDSATVTVRVPDHGADWDLFLAFPAATRRLVAPLRVALGGPPDSTAGPPGNPGLPTTITLDGPPAFVTLPPGLGTNVTLTGHGLGGVVSVALVSGTTSATDAAVSLRAEDETTMDLTVMLHPTAVPGSTFDLVVTGASASGTVTLIKPRFVVVGEQFPSTVMEFPAGSDSLHVFNPVATTPWLCPNEYYSSAYACGVFLVRLPASGDLTSRLVWLARGDPDDSFYGRLTMDPPGHITVSARSPIVMVAHGNAGDVVRVSVSGAVYQGFIDFLFQPDP